MGLGIKTALKDISKAMRSKALIPIEHVIPENRILTEKVALIAGGSGGIGMAVAKQLHAAGAKIILGGTNASKLRCCSSEFGDESQIGTLVMDVSNPENASATVEEAVSLFGCIDIFINSSGVHTPDVNFWTMTPDEFDRVLNINLRGAFFSGQAVARYMVDAGIKGHILFVNSSRGFEPAWSPYGISKWGLRGMTMGFAQMLLPYGIIVNGIAPGSTATSLIGFSKEDSIDTQENGLGRLATPDEIATWVKMLVSGSGDMVIGETLLVSGGRGSIDVR